MDAPGSGEQKEVAEGARPGRWTGPDEIRYIVIYDLPSYVSSTRRFYYYVRKLPGHAKWLVRSVIATGDEETARLIAEYVRDASGTFYLLKVERVLDFHISEGGP